MGLSRRGFLAGILAAGVAPAIVRNPMKIFVPKSDLDLGYSWTLQFDLAEWHANGKFVKRPLIARTVEAPEGFNLLPDPAAWMKALEKSAGLVAATEIDMSVISMAQLSHPFKRLFR